jgi:hypothetical protein
MTLQDVIRKHDLRVWQDTEVVGSDRWITVVADQSTPQIFGDLHKATDYTMCNALPREHGMLFMFQRNAKPARQGGQ